ncbi:PhnD/SsuA/transferrin family substrate-binding protein [Tianweitania sp. BSSL-BM11]|uniref:PhnD/SsuA/transferrin family substrate-binding protein n=1 Tax=Tianweitania aestuarii TaxID=2814886 RepID=A0ABS5RUS8_9HYPH|nr:PhnD/SsuA/transferrin family substrate-binding protein [Tianweitania aestuarii]MBS9720805.1 PhnD/SsuA/transferrin family substrate-binding protein [Tianweitania aestuarii]
MSLIAALPMYDWPEVHHEVDAQWRPIRDLLRQDGIDAPDELTRDADLAVLWRSPDLIFAQTCWGPMELGLSEDVLVVGQSDYEPFEGGSGPLYSSAFLMRKDEGSPIEAPEGTDAIVPLDLLRGKRFIYNSEDSLSGYVSPMRDLHALGKGIDVFSEARASGAHRESGLAIARGEADVCACDCRSWSLFQRFEPEAAAKLHPVGWTAKRTGQPFIMARALERHEPKLRSALLESGITSAELTERPRVA